MKHIKSFNERYQLSLLDILSDYKDYFTKKGVFTKTTLEYSFFDNKLYIEFDIASAFPGGKNERDGIRNRLRSFGFDSSGTGLVSIELNDTDLKVAHNFFNSL